MSRVKVVGNYVESGAYELRYSEGPEADLIHLVIEPGKVFSIGNSIGGYFAKPIVFAGEARISLVSISGSQKNLPTERIRQLTSRERGIVLKPNFVGLWATSSGSARNGIFHRYTEPADEIEQMLEKLGCGLKILHRVEEICEEVSIGGALCRHQTGNGHGYYASYDGKCETLVDAQFVEEHSNQYHIGCCSSSGTYKVTGGTYLISTYTRQCMNGCWDPHIEGLWVTPAVDLEMLREELFPEYARQKQAEREEAQKAQDDTDTAEAERLWRIITSDAESRFVVEKKLNGFFTAEKAGRETIFDYEGNIYFVDAEYCTGWEKAFPRKKSFASSRISLLNAYRSGLLTAWAEAIETNKLATV
jgi:hypothetical protein